MTISSTYEPDRYVSAGGTTFAYTFKIFDEGDIRAVVTDTNGVDTEPSFTVTGVGNNAGGNVVFASAVTSGYTVTLLRDEPLTQEIDYVEGDDFPAAAHEEGLDRSAIRDQYLQEQINRSVKTPENSSATLSIKDPTGNGSKYLSLNSGATEIEYSTVVGTLDGVTISGGDALKTLRVNSGETGFEVGVALGDLAELDTINNANWSGTDLGISNGGTGASTAAGARTALDVYSTAEVDAAVAAASTIIQVVNTQTGATATGTTTIPNDDTIPQITEGDEYFTLAITPTSATNKLIIEVNAIFSNTGSSDLIMALFQDATANALAATSHNIGSTQMGNFTIRHIMTAGTTSATTFRIRAGSSGAGTTRLNGSGTRKFGGIANSSIVITEVAV